MSRFVSSKRVQLIPPYLFARIDKMKQDEIEKGADIINLGIGDPDLPTPQPIIQSLQKASTNPKYHQYPPYEGFLFYRSAVANWYKNRFDVNVNPKTEVLTLIGSKEGIGHMAFAFVNPGDIVLVPDPGYPVYSIGTLLSGGKPYFMPLIKENHFLPDLSKIPKSVLNRTKLMWLNYPNNPTGAAATVDFFNDVVKLAKKYKFIVCHDSAYSEIYYDDKAPPSFLNAKDAKKVGIEFHSLSKTYNMTGWRVGYASGHPDLIAILGKIKNNLDSGVFGAIQEAGVTALLGNQSSVQELRNIYQERRDILVNGLKKIGFDVYNPKGGFYVWITVPKKYNSMKLTEILLKKAAIVTTPGIGFGKHGEGYIRMTVTTTIPRLKEVVQRLSGLKL